MSPWKEYWAICGGVAASIYRETPRYTADIDIILRDTPENKARDIAEKTLTQMGYKPQAGWITDSMGKIIPEQAMVLGRESKDAGFLGIDFFLPVLPWVEEAVKRAQTNKLSYGFESLPTITVEDLFIAKLYALQGTPDRITDLDDLCVMAKSPIKIDASYLKEQIEKFNLKVPTVIADALKNLLAQKVLNSN